MENKKKFYNLKAQSYLKILMQLFFEYPKLAINNLEQIKEITNITILKGDEKVKSVSLEVWNSILHFTYKSKIEEKKEYISLLEYFPGLIKTNLSLFNYLSQDFNPNEKLLESATN